MRLSSLSGPEGHPLHPFVVPLPVGAFVSSLVFDILTWTRPGELPWLVDGAWWLIGIGLIGAGVAAAFGVLDLLRIPRGTTPWRIALAHSALNVAAAAVFLVGYIWTRLELSAKLALADALLRPRLPPPSPTPPPPPPPTP